MKKYLLILVGSISLLGVSTVKAETYSVQQFNVNTNSYYSSFIESNQEIVSNLYNGLYEKYFNEKQEDYPYYIITLEINSESVYMALSWFPYPVYIDIDSNNNTHFYYNNENVESLLPDYYYLYTYHFSNSSYDSSIHENFGNVGGKQMPSIFIYYSSGDAIFYFNHQKIFYSNYVIKFSTLGGNNLVINNYLNSGNSLTINGGNTFPTYQDALELNIISDPNLPSSNYTEINLNNYSYVALSLKDYTERDDFYTNVEVQGQYCLTPVYDYGLKEKKDVITGSKNQGCSPYYENYTPVRTYILENDIKNHAIYYLKAYDTTRDNKVKVDTSIFNIHYITSQDEDNPVLNINGRNYTTIPYSELTDSATISEQEGYVSGASCAVGDFNCMSEYTGFNFSDIFTKPLEVLKSLWLSIVSVFTLITSLISVLPVPMQYFLYLSFMLAIVLGIIKIVL